MMLTAADHTTRRSEWFASWFDSIHYHRLYAHRDDAEAARFVDRLIGQLRPRPWANVLDLGCGAGRHSKYLASKNLRVTRHGPGRQQRRARHGDGEGRTAGRVERSADTVSPSAASAEPGMRAATARAASPSPASAIVCIRADSTSVDGQRGSARAGDDRIAVGHVRP